MQQLAPRSVLLYFFGYASCSSGMSTKSEVLNLINSLIETVNRALEAYDYDVKMCEERGCDPLEIASNLADILAGVHDRLIELKRKLESNIH